MRHGIVALAVLLSCGVGLATADYVVIIANLGEPKQDPNDPTAALFGGGPGGVPGLGALARVGSGPAGLGRVAWARAAWDAVVSAAAAWGPVASVLAGWGRAV